MMKQFFSLSLLVMAACSELPEKKMNFSSIKGFTISERLSVCPDETLSYSSSDNNFTCEIPATFFNSPTKITVKVADGIINKINLELSEEDLNYSFSDLESELIKQYGDPTKIIIKGSKRGVIWFNDSNGFYTIAEFQDSKFYGKSIELTAASPKDEAEKFKIKKFIFPENDM